MVKKVTSGQVRGKGVRTAKALKMPGPPAPFAPTSLPSPARQKLKKFGLSDAGIRQLGLGQTVTDKNDRSIIARIVADAMG